ncbi:MAG: hypothetical protein ACI9GW_000278 [Halieaceae bacterium]|jgi:hypothetical protein
MNSFVREVTLKYQTNTTQGLYKPFLLEPLLAWDYGDTEEESSVNFQSSYLELLQDAVKQTLNRSIRNHTLVKEYEHLLSLGKLLVPQINAYINDNQKIRVAGELHDAGAGIGPSDVFVRGRFAAHSLGLFHAPP